MPASKPTLGYSSRTKAAVALRAEGLTEDDIARKIGVSRNAIAGLLARAKDSRQAPQIGRGTSRSNADVLPAKAAGIMLSHEAARPIHRPTSDGAMRVIELKLPEAQFGKLVEMARKAARTPSAYATDLFQAAYSARCAPTGDVALDAQVGRLGTPDAPAGPMIDMMTAELERVRAALTRADAKIAEMADEIEALSAGEAVSVDAATMEELATLREDAVAAMRQAQHERDMRDAALLEKDVQLEDARRRLAELHETLERRHELLEIVALREQSLTRKIAQIEAATVVLEQSSLSAAQLRQAKALRAAGNSIAEIAATLGVNAGLLRQSMGGK